MSFPALTSPAICFLQSRGSKSPSCSQRPLDRPRGHLLTPGDPLLQRVILGLLFISLPQTTVWASQSLIHVREPAPCKTNSWRESVGAAGPPASTLVPLETHQTGFSCLHTEDAPTVIFLAQK